MAAAPAVLKRSPSKVEAVAYQCQQWLAPFVRRAWRIVEGNNPLVWGWHLDAVCEHLEAVTRGEIRDLIINIPPKHSKSLISSVMWPAWEWISNPEQRWMCTSYAAALSLRDSIKCRDIITSQWYQRLWGPGSEWDRASGKGYKLRDDQNSATRFVNDKTGYRLATTCAGVGTGMGGNRILVDDPHSTLRVESEADREARIMWWQRVMSTRSDNPFGSRVIIMQRCHERDLTGYLLAEEGGFELLRLPARYEANNACTTRIGFQDKRKNDGDLLAPERFPESEVARLEHALGSYASAAQLQQRPSPREGGIFKRDAWQLYTLLPEKFDLVLDSWDMAFKDLKTSSYVCGQKWGFKGANRYLLVQVRGQWDFVRTCQEVIKFSILAPIAPRKYVEGKANGPAVMATLRDGVSGLLEFNPNEYGSKEARASAISPMQEAGNIFLPQNAPWVREFIDEANTFPFSRWNDQVDTMTQALLQGRKLLPQIRTDIPIVSMTRRSPWKMGIPTR